MKIPKVLALAPNQFVIDVWDENGKHIQVFQSYLSIIAIRTEKGIVLDERFWDYSVTTGKYRNRFLGETKQQTLKQIELGMYSLANLN